MNDDIYQQLQQNHPSLFQKSGDVEFSIGDGWVDIIDVLCGLISNRLENAKQRLKYALENPDAKFNESIAELETIVADELEKLPTLAQVKEKFGGLRFYINGGSDEVHNYIDFAEAMSYHTCEECGAPGESRNEGWIKVLCDSHHKEREEKNSVFRVKRSFDRTKLSDEI